LNKSIRKWESALCTRAQSGPKPKQAEARVGAAARQAGLAQAAGTRRARSARGHRAWPGPARVPWRARRRLTGGRKPTRFQNKPPRELDLLAATPIPERGATEGGPHRRWRKGARRESAASGARRRQGLRCSSSCIHTGEGVRGLGRRKESDGGTEHGELTVDRRQRKPSKAGRGSELLPVLLREVRRLGGV
jgi:hypothetical protein